MTSDLHRPSALARAIPLAICAAITLSACQSVPFNSTAHFEQGKSAEKPELAIEHFTSAIEVAAKSSFFHVQARLERGRAHLILARNGETSKDDQIYHRARAQDDFQAVASWDEATSRDHATAQEGLGEIFLDRAETGTAKEHFERVLEIGKESSDSALERLTMRANRELGWIELARADSEQLGSDKRSDALRSAQDRFFRGLEIDAKDVETNLGMGVSLQLRGQSSRAMPHLEIATKPRKVGDTGDTEAALDPRASFYLARAIEDTWGYQKRAIKLHSDALEIDRSRKFSALYSHLARHLTQYLEASEEAPQYFLTALLDHDSSDREYWGDVEKLATSLLQHESANTPSAKESYYGAVALAAARRQSTSEAVQALTSIRADHVTSHLDRVFPDTGKSTPPQVALGRARTLYNLARHRELEDWFEAGQGRQLEDQIENPAARDALLVRGWNLLDLHRNSSGNDTSAALERASRLFGDVAKQDTDSFEAELGRAITLGRQGQFESALSSYEKLAAQSTTDSKLFREVQQLHRHLHLSEQQRARGWSLLRQYSGNDTELQGYVRDQKTRIELRNQLFCTGCGLQRKSANARCVECGRKPADSMP